MDFTAHQQSQFSVKHTGLAEETEVQIIPKKKKNVVNVTLRTLSCGIEARRVAPRETQEGKGLPRERSLYAEN